MIGSFKLAALRGLRDHGPLSAVELVSGSPGRTGISGPASQVEKDLTEMERQGWVEALGEWRRFQITPNGQDALTMHFVALRAEVEKRARVSAGAA